MFASIKQKVYFRGFLPKLVYRSWTHVHEAQRSFIKIRACRRLCWVHRTRPKCDFQIDARKVFICNLTLRIKPPSPDGLAIPIVEINDAPDDQTLRRIRACGTKLCTHSYCPPTQINWNQTAKSTTISSQSWSVNWGYSGIAIIRSLNILLPVTLACKAHF